MKFHLVTTALLFAGLNVNAQKSTNLIDLNGYYDYQNFQKTSVKNWQVNAAFGRQFTRHFTAGVSFGYSDEQYLSPDSVYYAVQNGYKAFYVNRKYANTKISLGAWGRYTYDLDKRFYFFTQANAGLYVSYDRQLADPPASYPTLITYTRSGENLSIPRGAYFLTIAPAIGVNIAKGFGAYASIGGINCLFSHVGDELTTYTHINIDFSQKFTLGIQKIINTKKSRQQSLLIK